MEQKISASGFVYDNFMNAALNNGISMTDIKIATGSVYEAAYHLKLKDDELYEVFLAMEQMVKVKKTAIDIMSDAMGIKTEELNDKLEQMSKMSPDTLSKFADVIRVIFSH